MIKFEKLTKYYGDFCALKELSLDIEKGNIFGYIGPNGAGKTTTIRILAALMRPTSGSCYVDNVEVTHHPRKIKELVGYLPDFFGVYEGMRVYEYLDFFGAAFKIPRKQRKKRIDKVLEISGASYMSDIFVEALSRGMKQKVGIARTLIHDPKVLLLDEPLSGLDPTARVEMKNLLRNLVDRGKTILVSSHILPELSAICDTIGIINNGKLITSGPVNEVMAGIRQERLIEIKFLEKAGKAEQILQKKSEKHAIKELSRKGQMLRFQWKANDTQLSDLLSNFIGKGFRLVEFHEVPISLEEAFMELTAASR